MKYSVWVGGGEINNYQIQSKKEAEAIAKEWILEGYDDVQIEEIKEGGDHV
jgi:hypothetical protein